MLEQALSYLVGIGKKSVEVKMHALPKNQMLVCYPDGAHSILSRDRKVRADGVKSIADLIDWVKWLQSDDEWDDVDVECFVQNGSVGLTMNREGAVSDTAHVQLQLSVEWQTVQKMIAAPIDQKAFLKILRGPLAECVSPGYHSVFKSITFRSQSTTDRGTSTLGRSVDQEVTSSAGAIPSTIEILLPVYDRGIAPVSLSNISLCVDVNHDTERFELYPSGDCLQVAQNAAVSEIRGLLISGLPESALVVSGAFTTRLASEWAKAN